MSPQQTTTHSNSKTTPNAGQNLKIAFVLYPGFTALDIIGPFQVLGSIPGHDARFVAADPGSITDDTGRCHITATMTFADFTDPDMVVIGGSLFNTEPDQRIVAWLRQVHAKTSWTTSVCTGSIYLAAAGILDGVDATTHWTRVEQLEHHGARYLPERVVERGKVITGAGVSAGIDMALTLVSRIHGPQLAQTVQLGIEYDPHPPFDAGSPSKAPTEIVQYVAAALNPAAAGAPAPVA